MGFLPGKVMSRSAGDPSHPSGRSMVIKNLNGPLFVMRGGSMNNEINENGGQYSEYNEGNILNCEYYSIQLPSLNHLAVQCKKDPYPRNDETNIPVRFDQV